MNRTALRIGTVATLLAGGEGPSFPTIAMDAVYDSRNIDVSDLAGVERFPAIIVRTDEDSRTKSGHNGMPQNQVSNRRNMLRIEYGVMSARKNADGTPVAFWLDTDPALEAYIDLIEWQIESALFGTTLWARWWKDNFASSDYESHPLSSNPDESRIRNASRELVINIKMANDCPPEPLIREDLPVDTAGNPIPPLVVLPKPLRDVFDKIASDGGGDFKIAMAELRSSLEALNLPSGAIFPLLKSVRMKVPFDSPPPSGMDSIASLEAELTDTLPTP